MIQKLSITALVENTAGHFDLLGEWGLSLWIEADEHRILYDTGQGRTLVDNARLLGVDLSRADALVLSHGHSDHSGGIAALMASGFHGKVFANPAAFAKKYQREKDSGVRLKGMPAECVEALRHDVELIDSSAPTQIAPGVIVTGAIPRRTEFEDTGGAFFLELTGRAQQQLLAHEARLSMDERHHILQLVAETESAARLIVAAASPKTTRQNLVDKPAVGEHVERRVGCLHLHCAEGVRPVLPHSFEGASGGTRPAEPANQAGRILGVLPHAEREDDFAFLPTGKFEWNLDRRTGIQRRSHLAGEPRPGHRSRTSKCAIASEKLSPIARHGLLGSVRGEEAHPAGVLRVVRVAREQGGAIRGNFAGNVHRRFRPQVTQDPFHISRNGESARSTPTGFAPSTPRT